VQCTVHGWSKEKGPLDMAPIMSKRLTQSLLAQDSNY
jgi:hypothetical protein